MVDSSSVLLTESAIKLLLSENLTAFCNTTLFSWQYASNCSLMQKIVPYLMEWLKMTCVNNHVDCGYSIPCFISVISQISFVYFCLINYVTVHHHKDKTVPETYKCLLFWKYSWTLMCTFTQRAMTLLRWLAAGLHFREHGSVPGKSMWHLWWTKSHWDRFSLSTSVLPMVTFHCAHSIICHCTHNLSNCQHW